MVHTNDLFLFLKKIKNPEQKHVFLSLAHKKADKITKDILKKHIEKKTFPTKKELGGGIIKSFKKATNSLLRKGKTIVISPVKNVSRGVKTLGNIATQHFHGATNFDFGNKKRNKKINLTDLDKTMAKLSDESYKSTKKRENVNGFQYDVDISTKDHALHKKGNKIVLTARGTDPTNLRDLRMDKNILLGNFENDKRFKTYEKFYKRAQEKYPNATFITNGHSAGGSQSLYLGHKYDLASYAFNAGVGTTQNWKTLVQRPKARQIIQAGDIISNVALTHDIKNGILLGSPSLNALANHEMKNFIGGGFFKFFKKNKIIKKLKNNRG